MSVSKRAEPTGLEPKMVLLMDQKSLCQPGTSL